MDEMMFPYNWEGFLGDYSFIDHREFYTNGARLIPTFRVEQLIEHYFAPDNNVGHKWIPVTERLPKDFVSVIIFVPSESPLPMVKEAYRANGCWATKMQIFSDEEVTHWMPLPEPPEGK